MQVENLKAASTPAASPSPAGRPTTLGRLRSHLGLPVVLGLYLALAVSYSLSVPAWEAPDEPAHFAYTHHIVTRGGPPVQSFEEGRNQVETGHHPPLYYYLGAAASLGLNLSDFSQARVNPYFSFANTDGGVNRFDQTRAPLYPQSGAAVARLRAISILFGAGTLICIYLSGLLVFAGQRGPALLATALTGLLPQFAFLSGAANNDNAVIFFCALTFLLCLRLALAPPEERFSFFWLAGLGLVVGLGLLSKYNEIIYIPVVVAALGLAAWRRRSPGFFVRGALLSGAACLLVAGWWFVRAQLLYGDPAGWNMWRSSFQSIEQSQNFQVSGQFLAHVWSRWFNSFWGYFGWFNLPFEPEIYKWLARLTLLFGLSILAMPVGGGLAWLLRSRRPAQATVAAGPDRRVWTALTLGGLALGLTLLVAFNYAVTFGDAGTQGRYLFPALPPLALATAAGLVWSVRMVGSLPANLARRLADRPELSGRVTFRLTQRKPWPSVRGPGPALGLALAGLLTGGLLVLNIHAIVDIIRPAYLPLEQVRAQVVAQELPAGAVRPEQPAFFGPNMRLEGYTLPAGRDSLKAGSLKVTFYWRAAAATDQNWVLFVHLLSGGQRFAQNDGPPAQGRYGVYRWQPGELIRDERSFKLEEWQVRQIGRYNAPLQLYLGWLSRPAGERARLENGADALTIEWK